MRDDQFYWNGPGWYAPRQEGSYDETRIVWRFVGDSIDEPTDIPSGLGTPSWFDDNRNGAIYDGAAFQDTVAEVLPGWRPA